MAKTAAAPPDWSPVAPLDTPYRKARDEWDKRMGNLVIQAKNWRLAAFAALAFIAGPAVLGMAYLGAQPKAVPHIVLVDKLGGAVYAGPAGISARDFKPSEASLRYHLQRFIDYTRTLSTDREVVQRNWIEVFSLVTPNAANQLKEYAEKTQPVGRADKGERTNVEIIGMTQVTRDSWQVDWKEILKDRGGSESAVQLWRGSFRLVFKLPEKEEQLAKNPIGLFVDEYHWSRLQG
jgi:type IV secretory pathway TrbF-like protein